MESNSNMPVSWCSSANHSNIPKLPGTMDVLLITVIMPNTTCAITRMSGHFFALLNAGEFFLLCRPAPPDYYEYKNNISQYAVNKMNGDGIVQSAF